MSIFNWNNFLGNFPVAIDGISPNHCWLRMGIMTSDGTLGTLMTIDELQWRVYMEKLFKSAVNQKFVRMSRNETSTCQSV